MLRLKAARAQFARSKWSTLKSSLHVTVANERKRVPYRFGAHARVWCAVSVAFCVSFVV